MRVLVAMSGGVDSSVAAAMLVEQGHEVAGATLKLWGGDGDSGCCSVADAVDARRVADSLGIDHRVFDLTEDFDAAVVRPYVEAHAAGRTPNPCVECNRHLKFRRFLDRAMRLGFDAVATGHHARVVPVGAGPGRRLLRGADPRKDQSYVLSVLTSDVLEKVLLPIGDLTKAEVRERARALRLRTAEKPESQDVCFIASRTPGAGREAFLGERIELHTGRVLDATSGQELGTVRAVELVTVGQRRGLGAVAGARRYALDVDVAERTVVVGDEAALDVDAVELTERTWVREELEPGRPVSVQVSAHGAPRPAFTTATGIAFARRERRVAPGQLVGVYVGPEVVGSGVAR